MACKAHFLVTLLASVGMVANGVAQVDFYFEIGCPVCETLLSGVMQQLGTTYAHAVNVNFHPFGNTYFPTTECGGPPPGPPPAATINPDPRYDFHQRECWDSKCGSAAPQRAADCFTGDPITQHGVPAMALTYYAVCAKEAAGTDWKKMLKFSTCLDKSYNMGAKFGWPAGTVDAIGQDCAEKSSLNFGHLKACARGPAGKALLVAAGKQTPMHTLVPFVHVDGKEVPDVGNNPAAIISQIRAASARRLLVV